jgi:oligo-alginate lyase
MKNLSLFMLLAAICISCNKNTESKEFIAKSDSQVKSELEAFIENYNWQNSAIKKHPMIAVTSDELRRLKAAWTGSGAEHMVIENRIKRVDKILAEPINFPPEGGQHNQWYQCSDCQIGLVTIDPTHHKCPQCQKVYSGFPYDNVLFSRQHSRNFSMAEDAAWAWAITGDKKYAEFSAKVLQGYAERYLNYPMVHAEVNDKSIDVAAQKNGRYRSAGHIAEQTLNEAMLMIPIVTAYDLIYDSKVMSKEDKKLIEEKLIRAMADCINVHKTGKSNWQTWHNTALFYAGTVLGDKAMVKQAFLDPENGFITQMKISVFPEGMWYENSWGYHYYTLSALTLMAEGARRLGTDIYSHEMLNKMYLIAFKYLMSDGSLPRSGDAVNDSPENNSTNEKAFAVYKDDRLLSTLPTEPTWDMILSGRKATRAVDKPRSVSNLIPGAGQAILATYGPGKLTAALTFGPYGGFHGHFDKLSFVFFGYSQELGVDPGRAASQAYRLPIHQQWYKATTGHNAILVDGNSQKEAEGELLNFAATDSFAAVSADAGPAFDNIIQRRFLLLTPAYLLVIDELRAADDKEHTFDWLYHNKGRDVSSDLSVSRSRLGDVTPGFLYLKDIAAYKVKKEKTIKLIFHGEQVTTYLTMTGQTGDEVFTATGPLASIVDRVPMTIVRRKGKTVYFISVLEPVSNQAQPDIESVNIIEKKPLLISVAGKGGEDLISFSGESLGDFTVFTKKGQSDKTIVLKTEKK